MQDAAYSLRHLCDERCDNRKDTLFKSFPAEAAVAHVLKVAVFSITQITFAQLVVSHC